MKRDEGVEGKDRDNYEVKQRKRGGGDRKLRGER